MPQIAKVRDVVLFPHEPSDKTRIGVVMDANDTSVVVLLYGTGTKRELPRVEVQPDSREGKALRVYKPTYFYAETCAVVRAALKVVSRCPPELFTRLRGLLEQAG